MAENKGPRPMVEIDDEDGRVVTQAGSETGAASQGAAGHVAQHARAQTDASQGSTRGAASGVTSEEAAPAGDMGSDATESGHPLHHVRKSTGDWLRENFPGHENAVFGGICGLVIAVLVFAIGFWQTLFITICVVIGVAIGQYADGNPTVVRIISTLFGGRE